MSTSQPTGFNSDTQAAIDAGTAIAHPEPIGTDHPAYTFVVPNGGLLQVVDTESYADRPRRQKAIYAPATVEAFADLVARHDEGATTVWVHPSNGKIVAIFNDHETGVPGWRDHRAELVLRKTSGWEHWLKRNGSLMSQREFAEHVEDGLTEIAAPPAADLLELAQTFQAKQDVTFRSAVRLASGAVQAQYDELIDASAGQSGQIAIPQEFTLVIAPFLGEDGVKLTARLRFRLNAGKLTLGYKLDRPEDVLQGSIDVIAERLRSLPAAVPVFIGEP